MPTTTAAAFTINPTNRAMRGAPFPPGAAAGFPWAAASCCTAGPPTCCRVRSAPSTPPGTAPGCRRLLRTCVSASYEGRLQASAPAAAAALAAAARRSGCCVQGACVSSCSIFKGLPPSTTTSRSVRESMGKRHPPAAPSAPASTAGDTGRSGVWKPQHAGTANLDGCCIQGVLPVKYSRLSLPQGTLQRMWNGQWWSPCTRL